MGKVVVGGRLDRSRALDNVVLADKRSTTIRSDRDHKATPSGFGALDYVVVVGNDNREICRARHRMLGSGRATVGSLSFLP